MSSTLQHLGMIANVGGVRLVTTFDDNGLPFASDSPWRKASRHVDVTLAGFLAGAMRVLRNPYVVYALTGTLARNNKKLSDHLLGILDCFLMAGYGDEDTCTNLTAALANAHRGARHSERQPDWFAMAIGGERDFSLSEEKVQYAVGVAISAGIARAHKTFGVLDTAKDGGRTYCAELSEILLVLGAGRLPDFLSYTELQELPQQATWPLMGAGLLRETGVMDLLPSLLDSSLGDGRKARDLAPLFFGLMRPEDRAAFCLPEKPAEEALYQNTRRTYRERNQHLLETEAGYPDPNEARPDALTSADFFTVSLRGQKLAI